MIKLTTILEYLITKEGSENANHLIIPGTPTSETGDVLPFTTIHLRLIAHPKTSTEHIRHLARANMIFIVRVIVLLLALVILLLPVLVIVLLLALVILLLLVLLIVLPLVPVITLLLVLLIVLPLAFVTLHLLVLVYLRRLVRQLKPGRYASKSHPLERKRIVNWTNS